MQLRTVVEVSRRVTGTGSRLAKVAVLADLLRNLGPAERPSVVSWLAGSPRQGRIGVGPATVRKAARAAGHAPGNGAGGEAPPPGGEAPSGADGSLTVRETDAALDAIARTEGTGASRRRLDELTALFRRATPEERDFLAGVLLGEIRQGALEGVLVEAVARAAEVDAGAVRRAHMLSGDLAEVAETALRQGIQGLQEFRLELFRPVHPMLAQTADDVGEALRSLGEARLEHKLDGARVQVHRAGDRVRVYSRRLREVTGAVPEVVEAVAALPDDELVLDGEVVALRADGTPHAFQTTMRRFGRKLDVERMRRELPLTIFFFDCLRRGPETLVDRAGSERFDVLADALPQELRVPAIRTGSVEEAEAFFEGALAAGHEGVMAKDLEAAYEAGRRGGGWLKVKPTHALDLVVLGAEWGHGRRSGWLSNLHLGARDPETGGFVMVGKTFKGLTDELLEWQTHRFLELATEERGGVVFVRPEEVVEVAFNNVQRSPEYSGGVALRFARVRAYRPDKAPRDADTVETLRGLLGPGESG